MTIVEQTPPLQQEIHYRQVQGSNDPVTVGAFREADAVAFWVGTYVEYIDGVRGDDLLDFAIIRGSAYAEKHPEFAAFIVRSINAAARARRREIGDDSRVTYLAACKNERPWPGL